jgi:hypothetical protein
MARVSSRDPCVFTVYQKLRLQLIQDDYRDGDKAKAGAAIKSTINNTNEFLAVSDGPEASKLQGGRARASKFLAGLNVPDDKLAELALAQGFDKVIVMARMLLDMLYEARGFNSASVNDMAFTFDASSRRPTHLGQRRRRAVPSSPTQGSQVFDPEKNAKNKSGGVGLSRHGSFFHKDIVVTSKHKLRTEALSYELVRVQARGHNLQL